MASCSPVSGLHESTHEVILGIAGEAVKPEQANTGHEKTRPSRTRQKPAHNSLSAEKLDPSWKGAYSIGEAALGAAAASSAKELAVFIQPTAGIGTKSRWVPVKKGGDVGVCRQMSS
jgi:hypothetical protein